MTYYEIEKDIPLPSPYERNKHLISIMEIGDSFCAPKEERQRLSSLADYHRKKHEKAFAFRAVDSDSFRVWRTK